MSEPPLAPSNDSPGQYCPQAHDPFAGSNSVAIPSAPPCAIIPSSPRSARFPTACPPSAPGYSSTNHDRTSSQQTYVPGMHGSLSSVGSGSTITPPSSIDLEKSSIARERAARGSRGSNRDPEKALYKGAHGANRRSNAMETVSLSYSEDDGEETGRRRQEENAVKILLFLSGPVVILSALNTMWACISLVITLLSQPVRICAKRPTFGQQLAGLLGPTLNLQLKCTYTPLPPHADEDTSYHAPMLVAVHMLSPFLALGMMFSSWVVAAYWVCSAILGDPAGLDKRDDGRETVLGLRGWWEAWLMRSVAEQ
jgi:hypothetical protein